MQTAVTPTGDWRKRKHRRMLISKSLAYLFTTVLAVLFAVPFIWMLSMSLQGLEQIVRYPPTWIPKPVMWRNYPDSLSWPGRPFHLFFKNSAIYTVLATLGVALSSSFVAFGFARVHWPARDALFVLVLSTMMLPHQVILIPQFMVFWQLGWLDSLKPLIIPQWFGSAFNIFLLRQFFLTLPTELDESAILDGCNYLGIWWRIIMPLAKPALVTVVAFSIVRTWNDFMGPLIYIQSTGKKTVSLGLRLFGIGGALSWGDQRGVVEVGQMMAVAVMSLFPILLLFIAAQRYFVAGIAMTGLREG